MVAKEVGMGNPAEKTIHYPNRVYYLKRAEKVKPKVQKIRTSDQMRMQKCSGCSSASVA